MRVELGTRTVPRDSKGGRGWHAMFSIIEEAPSFPTYIADRLLSAGYSFVSRTFSSRVVVTIL